MNSINLVGNLGAKPESFTYGPQGDQKQGAKFRIAVSRRPRNGQPQDPNWFNVTVFGPQAAAVLQHLDKGRTVAVQGEMDLRLVDSTKHEGEKTLFADVIANRVDFVGPKPENGSAPSGEASAPAESKDALPF